MRKLKWRPIRKSEPVVAGAHYWVQTPRGRTFIERAKNEEHFVSGYDHCLIAGPIEEPAAWSW